MSTILFLGTGPTRIVERPKEKRTNSSVLILTEQKNILIDCTPYFLEQIKREKIKDIDAVIISHGHNDACGGLPELNSFLKEQNKTISLFAEEKTLEVIKEKFKRLSQFNLSEIITGREFYIGNNLIVPFRVIHAEAFPTGKKFPTIGLKFDSFVYAEDFEEIPKESEKYLKNKDVLILDSAMYFGRQIRGHLSTDKTIELGEKFNPNKLILIQAGHTYPNQIKAEKEIKNYQKDKFPKSNIEIILAYDGMKIETKKMVSTYLIEVKEGIYLVKPHGTWIWDGSKTLIVKGKNYSTKAGKLFYLIQDKLCYGIIKLGIPKKISLREFKHLYSKHKITEAERIKWWENHDFLYAYNFKLVKKYEQPRSVKVPIGAQTFIKEVEFLSETISPDVAGSPITASPLQPIKIIKPKEDEEDELIQDIKNYNPANMPDKVLLDDHRITHAWYSTIKSGKKFVHSLEDVINLHNLIKIEMIKRGMTHNEVDELDKEKLKQMQEEVTEQIENLNPLLEQMKPIILINDFASLVGSIIKRPKGHIPKDIDIHLRIGKNIQEYLERAISVRLNKILDEKYAEKLHIFSGDAEGSHDTFLPVYHLALIPADRVIIAMSQSKLELLKPYYPMKPFGSADYQIEKVMNKIKEGQKYVIEFKYNGFHAVIHKKGNEVKIFSEQKKDLTKAFPTLCEEIKKLSNSDFIIDGELVPYKGEKALGRNILMKYTGAVKSGKTPDDSMIKLHAWDITYLDKDLTELPLYERIKYLDKLKATDRITSVPRKIVQG